MIRLAQPYAASSLQVEAKHRTPPTPWHIALLSWLAQHELLCQATQAASGLTISRCEDQRCEDNKGKRTTRNALCCFRYVVVWMSALSTLLRPERRGDLGGDGSEWGACGRFEG